MDQDLDFMINALSRSSSPLRGVFSHDQLMEMRDSFALLQRMLRSHPMDFNMDVDNTCHPSRVKAGGNNDWNVPRATELPRVVPAAMPRVSVRKFRFPPRTVNKATQNSKSSMLGSTRSVGIMASESTDQPASGSDNDQALVPYEPSLELVRYTPPSGPSESDDEDDDDGAEAFESETLCPNASCGNVSSILSFRIPVEMEYVWCNGDFTAESTDSEMTIIADGCNFILSN